MLDKIKQVWLKQIGIMNTIHAAQFHSINYHKEKKVENEVIV